MKGESNDETVCVLYDQSALYAGIALRRAFARAVAELDCHDSACQWQQWTEKEPGRYWGRVSVRNSQDAKMST